MCVCLYVRALNGELHYRSSTCIDLVVKRSKVNVTWYENCDGRMVDSEACCCCWHGTAWVPGFLVYLPFCTLENLLLIYNVSSWGHAGFPLTLKVRELIWSGKVGEFCWWSRKFCISSVFFSSWIVTFSTQVRLLPVWVSPRCYYLVQLLFGFLQISCIIFKEVDVWVAANRELAGAKLSDAQRMALRMEYIQFLSSVVVKLHERSPLKYSLVRAISCLLPSIECGSAMLAEKKNEELDPDFVWQGHYYSH